MADLCPCVARHNPQPRELNAHHILPKSWGGQSVATNLIVICPTTHSSTHQLLNAYVHAGGTPDKATLALYNRFTQGLAKQAWDQRPNDKPPYTTQHGVIG